MISVVVLFIAAFNLDMCSQCCTAYQCSDYKTSPGCLGGQDYSTGTPCYWDDSCRIGTCADLTTFGQSQCESYAGSRCKWSASAACVEVSSCSAWNGNSDCSYKNYDAPCIVDGSTCKAATCADFSGGATSYQCESNSAGLSCAWSASTQNCAPVTSCSAWSNAQDIGRCDLKYVNGGYCFSEDGVCKQLTCASLSSSQTYCEMMGCKYSSSSSSCSEVTSCGGWTDTNQTACQSRFYDGIRCIWKSDTCQSSSCSDYNSSQNTCESASGSSISYCKWDNNNCVHVDTYCESISSQSACSSSSSSCTYLEGSCPSPPSDGASLVFVPTAVTVLAALLSLVFW